MLNNAGFNPWNLCWVVGDRDLAMQSTPVAAKLTPELPSFENRSQVSRDVSVQSQRAPFQIPKTLKRIWDVGIVVVDEKVYSLQWASQSNEAFGPY